MDPWTKQTRGGTAQDQRISIQVLVLAVSMVCFGHETRQITKLCMRKRKRYKYGVDGGGETVWRCNVVALLCRAFWRHFALVTNVFPLYLVFDCSRKGSETYVRFLRNCDNSESVRLVYPKTQSFR